MKRTARFVVVSIFTLVAAGSLPAHAADRESRTGGNSAKAKCEKACFHAEATCRSTRGACMKARQSCVKSCR